MNTQHLWLNVFFFFSHVQLFIILIIKKSLLTKKCEAAFLINLHMLQDFSSCLLENSYSAWTKSTSVRFCRPGVPSEVVNANVGLKFVCSTLFRLFCPLALVHAYLLLCWWMRPRVCCLNWRLRCPGLCFLHSFIHIPSVSLSLSPCLPVWSVALSV